MGKKCLLFLTFSVLVANPKKLLYTVANPARCVHGTIFGQLRKSKEAAKTSKGNKENNPATTEQYLGIDAFTPTSSRKGAARSNQESKPEMITSVTHQLADGSMAL